MNKNISLYWVVVFLAVMLLNISCGGGGNKDVTPPTPSAATLISPAENSACITGSSVTFNWNKADNAESYDLIVKNLLTQATQTFSLTDVSYTATLTNNTPYSWYVVSKSSKTTSTSQSSVCKFYLSGTPAKSYAPFPATAVNPASSSTVSSNGATTISVTLQWSASDVDNDIASYNLFLDNTNASTQIATGLTTTSLTQTLTSGKTYYWKVVTYDKAGNSSQSEVFMFSIN